MHRRGSGGISQAIAAQQPFLVQQLTMEAELHYALVGSDFSSNINRCLIA